MLEKELLEKESLEKELLEKESLEKESLEKEFLEKEKDVLLLDYSDSSDMDGKNIFFLTLSLFKHGRDSMNHSRRIYAVFQYCIHDQFLERKYFW